MKVIEFKRKDDVTPKIILEDLLSRVDDLREIHVVAIDKDLVPEIGCTGDLKDLAFAVLSLQNYFTQTSMREE